MAKNIVLCLLFIAVIILAGVAFVNRHSANESRQRAELARREIKAILAKRDSLEAAIKLTRDTLELAYLVANNARIDVNKAKFESQKWRQQYESIRFKPYTDSQRDSVWTALYPAGDSIR